MTYQSLQDAVDAANAQQIATLKRHDVWKFDDDTFEVVRFDPGDTLLGSVALHTGSQKPGASLVFNLPYVKNTPQYLGVMVDENTGKVAWLGKSAIHIVTLHANNIAEFTCSKAYAEHKGLPPHKAIPVFSSEAFVTQVLAADELIPHHEVVHEAKKFVQAKKGQKLKPGGFGPLGGNNVASQTSFATGLDIVAPNVEITAAPPGGHLIPVDLNAVVVEMPGSPTKAPLSGIDYAEIEQKVVAHYGIDWADDVGKFVPCAEIGVETADELSSYGKKINAKATLAALPADAPGLKLQNALDVVYPLHTETKHFLGVKIDGKVIHFRKASLVSWMSAHGNAVMRVPISVLKSKKLYLGKTG